MKGSFERVDDWCWKFSTNLFIYIYLFSTLFIIIIIIINIISLLFRLFFYKILIIYKWSMNVYIRCSLVFLWENEIMTEKIFLLNKMIRSSIIHQNNELTPFIENRCWVNVLIILNPLRSNFHIILHVISQPWTNFFLNEIQMSVTRLGSVA